MGFNNLLNKTCIIESKTETQDAAGQMIESWATAESDISCRLDPTTGTVVETPKAVYEIASHILFMREPTTSLSTETHRIDVDGDKFNLLLISKVYGFSDLNHLELVLEKIS